MGVGLTPFRGEGPVFTPGFCRGRIGRLGSPKQVTGLREREGLEEEVFSKSPHWAYISGPQFYNMDEIAPGSL